MRHIGGTGSGAPMTVTPDGRHVIDIAALFRRPRVRLLLAGLRAWLERAR